MRRTQTAIVTLVLSCALGLAGCGQGQASGGSPSQSSSGPTGGVASQDASPMATASDPTAGIPSPGSESFRWREGGRFAEDGAIQLVYDASAWNGGFIAIGHAWLEEFVGGNGEPRLWLSEDGRSWTAVRPDFGVPGVELRGILPLAAGGVVVVGTIPSAGVEAEARAWRSSDGRTFTAVDLPSDIAGPDVEATSGPIGHLLSTGRELWYSADTESWQLVHTAPKGIELRRPVAGDEGFVAPAVRISGDSPHVMYASGDGRTWYEGTTASLMPGAAPWRGDWLGWGYTDEPATISVLRSSNGLDWSVALDVNELTPPDGPKAGLGMESGITEVSLAGQGGIVAMTLGWNHCCATPPNVVDVFVSVDAETWMPANLPRPTYVSSVATDGQVVVLAGHYDRGRGVIFWMAER